MKRIMIAAPKSGSGKTIITCGLLACLKSRDLRVRAYKCGPDYIDPMFHRRVIGIPGGNLDTFFSEPDEIRRQIAESDSDYAVIEGVMGIYDGIAGASGKGSCYDVAGVTGTPVILVMDVKGMGTTMIPVIKGILGDDKDCLIRGIVLNRISPGYLEQIRPLVDDALREISETRSKSVVLLGGIPNMKEMKLESRHLGLMMPDEIEDLTTQVEAARNLIEENLDTDVMLEIMCQAEDTGDWHLTGVNTGGRDLSPSYPGRLLTIAVARDEAFCFYYEENLRMLESCGIRVREFSPLHDALLPEEADGILLGGGYPELHAEALSANKSMRDSVREAIEDGMPCLAECGGFMYLLDGIEDKDGTRLSMCGVIGGTSSDTGKLGRFGYITVSGSGAADSLLSGLSVKGHEFHYFDSDNNGSDAVAVKPGSGKSWECIHADSNCIMGFPHLWYPSCPELVFRFRDSMMAYRESRMTEGGE
ncbi:MAG: cobyrinate a,c-diamide synthase [Mogibacterium sp.]|nr:cobyrinate a,c-diamide synthase [Mogibacterium sp.]